MGMIILPLHQIREFQFDEMLDSRSEMFFALGEVAPGGFAQVVECVLSIFFIPTGLQFGMVRDLKQDQPELMMHCRPCFRLARLGDGCEDPAVTFFRLAEMQQVAVPACSVVMLLATFARGKRKYILPQHCMIFRQRLTKCVIPIQLHSYPSDPVEQFTQLVP